MSPRPAPLDPLCSVDDCSRPSKTRGMCGAHAERVRTGLPLDVPIGGFPGSRTSKPFDALYVHAESGCWEWIGGMSTGGYGTYRGSYAHRFSYERAKGEIPHGLQIDHLCRNRKCVNPEHLEAVTPRVNYLRGVAASAIAVRTNKCKRGHELTEDNVYRRANRPRKRECKTCVLAAQKAYYQRRRQQAAS